MVSRIPKHFSLRLGSLGSGDIDVKTNTGDDSNQKMQVIDQKKMQVIVQKNASQCPNNANHQPKYCK